MWIGFWKLMSWIFGVIAILFWILTVVDFFVAFSDGHYWTGFYSNTGIFTAILAGICIYQYNMSKRDE